MNYRKATEFYEQKGTIKGAKVMFITSNGIEEQVHGYNIISYIDYMPMVIEYVNTLPSTFKDWDDAYDALFGKAI